MRIAFVMLGAPRRHPLWLPVADRLARRGAHVEFLWPDDGLTDLGRVRVEHDLYVLKCGSGLGLSLAGALHALGAATLNPYPVVAVCRDKVMTSAVLAAAGVPVPDAWVMGDVSEARELLEDGPVIIKPQRGSRGAGVRVLWSLSELDSLETETGPVVAQRYHAPDGLDNKLYVIGGRLFGVRRVWPARTLEDKLGEAFIPGVDLRELARGCSAALGIDTFGLDVVYSGGDPLVVDVSAFPGFKGVPDADGLLSDVIDAAARRAVRGEPVIAEACLLVRRVPPMPSPVLLDVYEILRERGLQWPTGAGPGKDLRFSVAGSEPGGVVRIAFTNGAQREGTAPFVRLDAGHSPREGLKGRERLG